MAGDWIAMRVGLEDENEIVALSSRFGHNKFWTIGALYALWSIADQHSTDGRLSGWTIQWLDERLGQPGFSAALIDLNWLTQTDHGLELPNFFRWFGPTAKRRLQATKRKQMSRSGHAPVTESCDKNATEARSHKTGDKTLINPPNPPLRAKGGTSVLPNGRRTRRPPKRSLADIAAEVLGIPPDDPM